MTADRTEFVRFGDVMSLQRREVTINPLMDYRLIGVYSFGKGIFHREPALGAALGDYRFYAVEPGDLVLSNIQAWEGAIALATDADAGTVGTHRFLTYLPSDDRIDVRWMHYFLLSNAGARLVQRAAPGTAVRNRTLSRKRLEDLQFPLPKIEVQRQVVRSVDGALRLTEELSAHTSRSSQAWRPVLHSAIDHVVSRCNASGWRSAPLAALADINPRPVAVTGDQRVTFVPMSEVDELTGAIRASAPVMTVADLQSNYRQFRSGDVIFARITPCMQNGKTAIADLATEVGYGSTEFHVVRSNGRTSNRWIYRMLRTERFRREAATRFTGTAGQQRVPAEFMRNTEILIPPTDSDEVGS